MTTTPAFATPPSSCADRLTRALIPFALSQPPTPRTASAVWAVFSQSTGELGAGEEDGDDGGLSL